MEQIQIREKINEFLKSNWTKKARFEKEKIQRPLSNHFLAWEIYSVKTNPSEHETVAELNQMVKEGLLQLKVGASGWIWFIKL